MSEIRVDVVLSGGDAEEISLDALMRACDVRREILDRFLDHGLVVPTKQEAEPVFTYDTVLRVRTIQRLRRELGVNLSGVAVILDLTERVKRLQREIDDLRAST